MNADLQTLSTVLPLLSFRDAEFARSLISQSERRPLTDKQIPWVGKLIAKAQGGAAPQQAVNIGDMTGVIGLFDKAKQHLKYPAIVLSSERLETLVKLYPAGERAQVPGSITVVDHDKRDRLDRPVRYGRILKDGTFEVNPYLAGDAAALEPLLRAFAENPVHGAKESARLTGKCCFCHTKLKDERSTQVGYGKICAEHYGLPWGDKPAPDGTSKKGKRMTASAKQPTREGYVVVRHYWPEDVQFATIEANLQGMREEFPVIFENETKARDCYNRLMAGNDPSFFQPDSDNLSIERITYTTYDHYGQAMMNVIEREELI